MNGNNHSIRDKMIENSLYEYMNEMLQYVPQQFHRYMYNQIPWGARMIGLTGPRGVGKSTMLLQYALEHNENHSILYVGADNLWFASHSLVTLADEFVKDGGKYLLIDEIHKYKNWSIELKQIYDTHPALHVVFTGSSILEIQKGEADLSRRALMYHIQGLSFREYLELFEHIQVPAYSLHEILEHQVSLNNLEHPLPLFRKYLAHGYYPFAHEPGFALRIEQIVSQTVENDIPQYVDMNAATARKIKQMLMIISRLVPYKPSADSLASEVGVSKNNVPDYLTYLEKAGMIGLLRDDTSGMRALGKIEKAYIDNPSLMTVLAGGAPEVGNIRETFFYNQMRVNHGVLASRESDFCIGDFTFEVGGKKKGKKQIEDIPNGFVVKDEIEYGHGIVIPLWHFGLTY